jgi:hypothetical protein
MDRLIAFTHSSIALPGDVSRVRERSLRGCPANLPEIPGMDALDEMEEQIDELIDLIDDALALLEERP